MLQGRNLAWANEAHQDHTERPLSKDSQVEDQQREMSNSDHTEYVQDGGKG